MRGITLFILFKTREFEKLGWNHVSMTPIPSMFSGLETSAMFPLSI